MINADFFDFAKGKIEEGQSQFALSVKSMIFREDESLFEVLDFSDDRIFLEPLLFAYFNSNKTNITLKQILFGYIHPSKRFTKINVSTNPSGIIYLPKIGYLETENCENLQLELAVDNHTGDYTLTYESNIVDYKFKKTVLITGTDIEVQQFSNPLIEPYFRDRSNNVTSVNSNQIGFNYYDDINNAVIILKEYYPSFFSCFNEVIRCIMPFNSDSANSFATLSVHGTAFLNVPKNANEVFFIEDIVHQCGHTILTSITHEMEQFLAIDPDTPLEKFNLKTGEYRSVYVAFHGVFTEAIMNEAFAICVENKIFMGRKEHELKGRFAYILSRFLADMESLNHPEIFTPTGFYVYSALRNKMLTTYSQYGSMLKEFDLTNQPYTFSYDQFLLTNPLKVHRYA